jgi:hypothetical protein
VTRAKHRFTAAERFGVWVAHDRACFWCRVPIPFQHVSVDHIVAESLLDDPDELQRWRDAYELGDSFDVNGYENWAPAHSNCNSRKGPALEASPSPSMIAIFRDVQRRAVNAQRVAAGVERDTAKDWILARVERALETDAISRADLEELMRELPLDPDTRDATTLSILSTIVSDYGQQQFPGWTRITFEEQDDLIAALTGESLGPRNVRACPALAEVAEVVERLRTSGTAALLGESGSGKSMVAWHAAFLLHEEGWHIYLLTNAHAAVGEPPAADPRALLLIDNAQAATSTLVAPALASRRRAILVVSTSDVPGYRLVTRMVPKRAVETIASAFRARGNELLPLLAKLDPDVGEKPLDVSIERAIDYAAKHSEYAWQFMFNLTGGQRRFAKALDGVRASPPLDKLLYAIAVHQLVARDAPCPLPSLTTLFESDPSLRGDAIQQAISTLASYVPLVRTYRGVATPHPRIAARVIETMYDGDSLAASARRDVLWRVLLDPSASLRGINWVLAEIPVNVRRHFGLPLDVVSHLVDRCFASTDLGGCGYVLASLMRHEAVWRIVIERKGNIAGWIERCSRDDAHGVESLINAVINADRQEASELIGCASPAAVAARINTSSPRDGYSVGGLLGRLGFGSLEWRGQVAAQVDHERLIREYAACTEADVGPACLFIKAIANFDQALSLQLAESVVPAVAQAMRANPLAGFREAQDVLWWVLSFGPFGPEPDERQTAIARSICDGAGVEALANAFNATARRDWNGLDFLAAFVRAAAPALAAELSTRINVRPMLELFGEMARSGPYEVDHVLVALAFGEEYEPAATVVREAYLPAGRLTARAAAIAPASAVAYIRSGGDIDLGLAGGLPDWGFAAAVLARVHEVDEDCARILLRGQVVPLADGLAYRQANGGEDASVFLQVAAQIDRAAVIDAFRSVDVELARDKWTQRSAGTSDEQATMAELLSWAVDVGGEIAALALELRGRMNADTPKPASNVNE